MTVMLMAVLRESFVPRGAYSSDVAWKVSRECPCASPAAAAGHLVFFQTCSDSLPLNVFLVTIDLRKWNRHQSSLRCTDAKIRLPPTPVWSDTSTKLYVHAMGGLNAKNELQAASVPMNDPGPGLLLGQVTHSSH